MKKKVAIAAIPVLAVVFLLSCNQEPAKTAAVGTDATISADSLVKRGSYLVGVMGCNDCHSPKIMGPMGPEPDPNLLLSGHPAAMPVAKIDTATMHNWVLFNMMNTAVAGPWGVSFSANLTSDSTGIGNWTEEQFSTALRHGKSKGIEANRMLLPPMPWPGYAHLKDEDLKAIFAYLKSTKPVKNLVPAPIPPTQFNKKG
jgi:Cytochrome c